MTESNNIPANCPLCQSALSKVPAGISKKSGKSYNSFLSCVNRECSYTYNFDTPPPAAPQQNTQREMLSDIIRNVEAKLDTVIEQNKTILEQTKNGEN